MELSLFLAKMFGIYLLTFAALLTIRGKAFVKLLEEFLQDRKMVFLSGTILLAIGLAMAITHNVWELNFRGIISFMGYGFIAKGILRVGWPEIPAKAGPAVLKSVSHWFLIGGALLAGGYLTWAGFTQG
ncbi:MAG: hypothetical protein VB862_08155 [Pirellulaceae bacterium]